jgi:hypothetical protein
MVRRGKGPEMKPTTIIYWSRFLLGIATALICYMLRLAWETSIYGFFLGIDIFIITYFAFRYLFRERMNEIGETRRLLTIGIGAFFLSWIMFWGLFYSLFGSP